MTNKDLFDLKAGTELTGRKGMEITDEWYRHNKAYYGRIYDKVTNLPIGSAIVDGRRIVDYRPGDFIENKISVRNMYLTDENAIIETDSFKAQLNLKRVVSGNRSVRVSFYGDVEVAINWGDGTEVELLSVEVPDNGIETVVTHTYAPTEDTDVYSLEINGTCHTLHIGEESLSRVVAFGELRAKRYSFSNSPNLSRVPASLPTSVNSLRSMFALNRSLERGQLDNWDYSRISNMEGMFSLSENIELDLSGANLPVLRNMARFISGAKGIRLKVNGATLNELVSLEEFAENAVDVNVELTDMSLPKLNTLSNGFYNLGASEGKRNHVLLENLTLGISGCDRLASETHKTDITVKNVTLPNATYVSECFSDAVDLNLTIQSLDIPLVSDLSTFCNNVSSATDDVQASVAVMDVTVAEGVNLNGAFSDHADVNLVLDMSGFKGRFSARELFANCRNCTIEITDLNNATSGIDMRGFANGTIGCEFYLDDITLGDGALLQNSFQESGVNTLQMMNLTTGNNCNFDQFFAELTGPLNGELTGWTLGDNCSLRNFISGNATINLDMSNWTVGADGSLTGTTQLDDFISDVTIEELKVSDWTINGNISITKLLMGVDAFGTPEVDFSNWTATGVITNEHMRFSTKSIDCSDSIGLFFNNWCAKSLVLDSFAQDLSSNITFMMTNLKVEEDMSAKSMFRNAKVNLIMNEWGVGGDLDIDGILSYSAKDTAVEMRNLSVTGYLNAPAAFLNSGSNLDVTGWTFKEANLKSTFELYGSRPVEVGDSQTIMGLSTWDVSDVTSLERTFFLTGSNAEVVGLDDISVWNTISLVNAKQTFYGLGYLPNIENWNFSSVKIMDYTFSAIDVIETDVTQLDVSQSESFKGTFENSPRFNQDLSNWTVTSGLNFERFLNNAVEYSYDLSGWPLNASVVEPDNFADGSSLSPENHPQWP